MLSIRKFKAVHSIDEEDFGQDDFMRGVRKKLLKFKSFLEVVNGRGKENYLSVWISSLNAEAFASFSLEENKHSFNAASCTVACNFFEKKRKWLWLPWWLCRKYGLVVPRSCIYFNGFIKKQGNGEIEWNKGCYADLLDEVLYERGLKAEVEKEEALKAKKKEEIEKAKGELKSVLGKAEEKMKLFCNRILALNLVEIY